MISVVFTCRGRPALTELCLRRFKELMPEPYELFICYDEKDKDDAYTQMLYDIMGKGRVITAEPGKSRFHLINLALRAARGDYFMHLENDFYWVDPSCLTSGLQAMEKWPEIDFIRFEYLPFTVKHFNKFDQVGLHDILWMKKDVPYRFNFNPHIRRFKYPNGRPFKEDGFSKQPEQHYNDDYEGVSCCMTGDNFRHLGLYDEGGHEKMYYKDRFTGRRGTGEFDPWVEFNKVTTNPIYLRLFRRYLDDNRYKRGA